MAQDKQGVIHAATDGGAVGKHAAADPLQIFVGPSTSVEFNTARLRLIPIACFSVEDVRFKFDSSFPLPEVQAEIRAFVDLREKNPETIKGAPISIFGHADPSFQGNFELGASTHQTGDDYNKVLSGRRAIAIYALLTRDAALWNHLFTNNFGGDAWGEDSIRIILDTVDRPKTDGGQPGQSQGASGQGQSSSSSGNPNTGASDSARTAKVRDIAHDSGQRQKLFLDYMNLLCGDLKLDKTKDFLARGSGPDQKGDVQGCSRFNPFVLFSQEKEDTFKTAEQEKDRPSLDQRNEENKRNRRVMILIFRKGSQVLPAKWPCPSFKEGAAGCKKRFFSDGDTRRSTHTPGADRKFDDTNDTFACRFYQRISDQSPCEQLITLVPLTIRLINVEDQIFERAPYTLEVGEQKFEGQTSTEGIIRHMILSSATSGTLILTKPNWTVAFKIIPLDPPGETKGAQARLNNLGFFASEALDGNLDDQTKRSVDRFEIAHIPPIGLTKDPQGGTKGERAESLPSAESDSEDITPQVSATLVKVYGS